MSFAGTFGASGALIPATIITNIKGEPGVSYDAAGRIAFQSASGAIYTPDRVDTLFLKGAVDQAIPPLAALVAGPALIANADTGQLVTAAPAANQHGLPTNFGPGRGKWDGPTGQARINVEPSEELTVVNPALGAGSVVAVSASVGGIDAASTVRNFHGEALNVLTLRVECIHSIQG